MTSVSQRLILVTTTRADWGILSPLARALALNPAVRLTIAAGNMHLSEQYGNTIDEIRQDGFEDIALLGTGQVDTTAASRTALTADMARDMARLIDDVKPDGVIILGDRYEMLGVATAALIAGVPIVHLHGGEISEGAIDDSVRHALTKMASLHLVATEQAARNVIAMGEEPRRVVRTGAIGVEKALNIEPLSRKELCDFLDGFDIDPKRTLLTTFHPVTRHPEGLSGEMQIDNLLGAIADVPECNVIFTYPNNDTGSEKIIERIEAFAAKHKERVIAVKSLGSKRYLSAMRYVLAVVGNTSSGILEAPSTSIATIDIGPRQQGRERAASVVHVDDNRAAIADAIRAVMRREESSRSDNPYYQSDAVATAVNAIIKLLPTLPPTKKFYFPPKREDEV